MNISYIGEHTFLAGFGHFFVISSFVFAIIATFAYGYSEFIPTKKDKRGWLHTGRMFFSLHAVSAGVVTTLLFYIIYQHYFEFEYVWKYSNLSMPFKYIFSCFWSGQQGSFLLWSFWNLVLCGVLLSGRSKFEGPVLMVLLAVQAWIFSMLLGVYFGPVKIGQSPFILIRELSENLKMPWTSMPDYLQKVDEFRDGNGLNPLLQNYWMTIHPPTLFLGFALTTFPLAFAFSSLIRNEFRSWLQPAIRWSFTAIGILGAGILMGGAWAYEALSFGGFWAWDPVENASLVPFIILLAGSHLLLVYQKKQKNLMLTLMLCIAPFLLVLYSTFLTRSGVLGESSVHSFTGAGLNTQLLSFLFCGICASVFVFLSSFKLRMIYLLAIVAWLLLVFLGIKSSILILVYLSIQLVTLLISSRRFREKEGKEKFLSREFWIFMAAILFIASTLQIVLSTSIPVINLLFGTEMDAFTDLKLRNAFYKQWQLPLAMLLMILISGSLWLRYSSTIVKTWTKRQLISFGIGLSFLALLLIPFSYQKNFDMQEILFLVLAATALVSNSAYFIYLVIRTKRGYGATVAHIGFALLLLGAVFSTGGSFSISENLMDFDVALLDPTFENNENIILKKKEDRSMADYNVVYEGKEKEGVNLFYNVRYANSNLQEEFTLRPFVQLNEKFGNVPEPDTKHYLLKDVFTHVKWADLEFKENGEDDYMNESILELSVKQPVMHENLILQLDEVFLNDDPQVRSKYELDKDDLLVQANISLTEKMLDSHSKQSIDLFMIVKDGFHPISIESTIADIDTKMRITRLSEKSNTIEVGLMEKEYIVMSATVFPMINLLWLGSIVCVLGCIMAVWERHNRKTGNPDK